MPAHPITDEFPSAAAPNGVLLTLAAAWVSLIGVVSWAFIAFGAILPGYWGPGWIYSGVALPAAAIGGAATYATGRRAYFWTGIAITLIPLILFIALEIAAPPVPESWND